MKIVQNGKIAGFCRPEKMQSDNNQLNHGFRDMLREINRVPVPTGIGPENSAGIVERPSAGRGPVPLDNRSVGMDCAERLLDTLDEYRERLADPRFSLRDIEPLVKRMETENRSLIRVMDRIPFPGGVKDILHHVAIASSVELIRFNRGDYLNP